jgi:uncharacterized protein YggU (UPF0235/DUF167 family)
VHASSVAIVRSQRPRDKLIRIDGVDQTVVDRALAPDA